MVNSVPQITLIFADADSTQPDPAAVGATARTTVGALRAAGATITPDYTGTKGAAEVFQWLLDAATVAGPFATLTNLSLALAQLLNELRKLHEAGQPAPSPQPIIIVVRHEHTEVTIRSAATPLTADALLAQLLAEKLPEQLRPEVTTITVQVPPTPPNEI